MKLVHWPLMGGLLHLVQRGGDWAGPVPIKGLRLKCREFGGVVTAWTRHLGGVVMLHAMKTNTIVVK